MPNRYHLFSLGSLQKASEARKKLSHDFTVRDFNLTKAKTLRFLKQQSKELHLDSQKIEEEYQGLVDVSREKYVKLATRNGQAMREVKNFFAPRFGYTFASLNGHDVSVFRM